MSTTELALRNADPITVAKAMYASGLFADTKTEAQAVVKVFAGAEFGLGAFASMRGIHIFQGQASPSAHVLAGAVKRSGRYTFKRRTPSEENGKCSIEFFEKGLDGTWESLGLETYTMDDAKRAGLLGKPNWQKYPRNMLFARCVANGVRFHCPDVTGGPVLTAEEASDEEGIEFNSGGVREAPVPVQNQAEDIMISVAHVAEISALYKRTDWKKADAEDPHSELRMQLLAAGVDGNLKGDVQEIIARLTLKQYEALRSAMAEAAGPDDGEPVEVIGS